ncbi:response regulator [Paenibacillus sp. 1P07SE]|uniref:response regulator transcription factor n=1 Tax=Paenibacillus sp. 1P07SE TaxID=3132209 RepID=UPI0039A6E8EA
MHRILVVDDEPRVSSGIKNLLLSSQLRIAHVETALNGFEAIDYIRMEPYDLVLTDIQMSRMNGLELMETIYLEQPQLPVIVISAHEKFDFAKKSLSLGARDYLVKPVERDDLLRIVGKVLQEKEEIGKQSMELSIKQRERELNKSDTQGKNELLLELVTEGYLSKEDRAELIRELGDQGHDVRYAVIAIRLDLTRGGFSNREIGLQDRKLLKYAAINILDECLVEWNGVTMVGYGNELIAIIRLREQGTTGSSIEVKSQLHLIGQMIDTNLRNYLNIEATIGISTAHPDIFMLAKLMDMANNAAEWRYIYPSNKIFYYEDRLMQENLGIVDWAARVDRFVQGLKTSFGDKARRIDVESVIAPLHELGQAEELFNSYFGMLAYRLYGLLLEVGHGGGLSLQRFDPDVFFRGAGRSEKLGRLHDYVREIEELLLLLVTERDQSIVSRILSFIRASYRNPALKIQDIASEVHFSPAYLSYLFKKETKKNLWDYVTELRIEEARHLLSTTDKKRYEIAYAVGYESPEHFSRMFKRCVGVSPAEYRKEKPGGVIVEAEI